MLIGFKACISKMKKSLAIITLILTAFGASATTSADWLEKTFEGKIDSRIRNASMSCIGLYMAAGMTEDKNKLSELLETADECMLESATPAIIELAKKDGVILNQKETRAWLSKMIIDDRERKIIKNESSLKEAEAKEIDTYEKNRTSWKIIPADAPLICAEAIQTSTLAQFCYVKTDGIIQLALKGYVENQNATQIVLWTTNEDDVAITVPKERINNSNNIAYVWVDESFIYYLTKLDVMQIDVISDGITYGKTFEMTTLSNVAKKAGF